MFRENISQTLKEVRIRKLISQSTLVASVNIITICSQFFASKIVAVTLGPAGIALVGTLQNSVQLAVATGQCFLGNGVIRWFARYRESEIRQKAVLSFIVSVLVFSISFSALSSLFVFIFDVHVRPVPRWFFGLFALVIPIIIVNKFFLNYCVSQLQVRRWAKIVILQSFLTVSIMLILVQSLGRAGVVIVFLVSQLPVFLIVVFSFKGRMRIFNGFRFRLFRYFRSIIMMSLVSMTVKPVFELYVRSVVSDRLSDVESGLLQVNWYVNGVYLSFFGLLLSTHFFPEISRAASLQEAGKVLHTRIAQYLLLNAMCCVVVFFFGDLIVRVLFSEDFTSAASTLRVFFVANFMRIPAIPYAYVLISRGMSKPYVVFEILFYAVQIMVFQFVGVTNYGVAISYLFGCSFYSLAVMLFVENRIRCA